MSVFGRRAVSVLLAVVLPLAVSLAFPHPVARPIVPDAIMAAITVLVTVRFGPVRGALAVVSGTLSLWYFNFPPGYSFRLTNTEDAAALLAAGAIGLLLVGSLTAVLRREREAAQVLRRVEEDLVAHIETISTMQDMLLPATVPSVDGLRLGWHYKTGGGPTAPVGGDWIAFVPISDFCVGLAIGDVAGHGWLAVRTMAQYRFALRTLAVQNMRPAEVLAKVDEVAEFYAIPYFSTAIYGVLDTGNATWTFSAAGHPPALVLRGGAVHTLGSAHGPPLGSHVRRGPFDEMAVKLEAGDLLVMFTDGVVERRGESIDVGIDRLRNLLTTIDTDRDLNETSRALISDLAGHDPRDDTAIVIAHFRA